MILKPLIRWLQRQFGSKPSGSFGGAFLEVAEEVGIPEELQGPFCKALEATINNPRKAGKVAQDWLSRFEFRWPDGEVYLLEQVNKKDTFKPLCNLFVSYVTGKYHQREQWTRIHRSKDVLPYLLLLHGPTPKPCLVHKDVHGLVLKVEHPYWQAHPLCQSVFCRCRYRQVTRQEFKRLQQEGIPAPGSNLPGGRLSGEKIKIQTKPPA